MTHDCDDCRHAVSDIDPSTGELDFGCPHMDECGGWDYARGCYTFPRWRSIRGWEE